MSRYNGYENECGSCEEFKQCRGSWTKSYDINDTEKGYCADRKEIYWPDEDSCGRYKKRVEPSSDCYITTIVCDILGFDDNCDVLNTLRKLRNEHMQQKEEYKKDLYTYDTIGPEIATILKDDYKETKDDSLALSLYRNYLLPAVIRVKENNYQAAIEIYKNMTQLLQKTYKIESNEELLEKYDQSKGGHGRLKTRES